MMRRLSCLCALTTITLILGLQSHPSLAQEDPLPEITRLESPAHIAIHAGRVRVTITKTKPRLHLAKQQRPIAKLFFEDDDSDYYDELPDIQVGYRRPELIDQSVDLELSDHVKIRLALARMKALKRYEEIWS